MPPLFTISAVQPAVTWDAPHITLERIAALLGQAAQDAAIDLAILPEHFNATIEAEGDDARWQAAVSFAADLARRHQINLIAGSVERWDPIQGARLNTALVFDRKGQEVGRYDKRKLFGYETRRNVLPGQAPLVVELDGLRCGVLVCADLWYPELTRELASDIDILCVPAQTTIRPQVDPAYARLLWHSLAMTRAQENVLAVAISDQASTSTAPYRCGGVATITDPSAEPDLAAMQRSLPDGQEGYLVATIDLERLSSFRSYRRQNGLLPE